MRVELLDKKFKKLQKPQNSELMLLDQVRYTKLNQGIEKRMLENRKLNSKQVIQFN